MATTTTMEQQPKPMHAHVGLTTHLTPARFSLVLAAWLITWCTRQLWPGLIPTIGKHTLVVLTTQWRPDTTSTTVTSIHRVRRIRGPHSVHMSDHWKGTTSPTTSHGGLWKELHPITKICRLCICEKAHILFQPEDITLNQRSEFFSKCWHKDKHLLTNN